MIEIHDSPNVSNRTPGTHIDSIIIHATANASFDGALSWMMNPNAKVSSHYLIGKDGRTARLVPDEKRAWHAGLSSWDGRDDLNQYAIGIELVNLNDDKDPYPDAQIEALANLVADLLKKHKIILHNVVSHQQVAPKRKTDPGLMFPWFDFGYRVGVKSI